MNTTSIQIDNLKCHGCANTIRRELSRQEKVNEVTVDHETSSVNITYDGESERREEFARILKKLGYPEQGSGNRIDQAKSYVSCAIGRMSKESERNEENEINK